MWCFRPHGACKYDHDDDDDDNDVDDVDNGDDDDDDEEEDDDEDEDDVDDEDDETRRMMMMIIAIMRRIRGTCNNTKDTNETKLKAQASKRAGPKQCSAVSNTQKKVWQHPLILPMMLPFH